MMAKKKKNKKNKSSSNAKSKAGSTTATSSKTNKTLVDEVDDEISNTKPIWSPQEECDYYKRLGCHIIMIARLGGGGSHHHHQPPSSSPHNNNTSSYKKKSRNKTQQQQQQQQQHELDEIYHQAQISYPNLLGIERFDPSDYHPDDIIDIPDVAIRDPSSDDDGGCLTVTNSTNLIRIVFLTIYDVDVCDANGEILTCGTSVKIIKSDASSRSGGGSGGGGTGGGGTTRVERKCTTFIVLCPPFTFVHLCSLCVNQRLQSNNDGDGNETTVLVRSWTQLEIESDVQPWSNHRNVNDEHSYLLHFPFVSSKNDNNNKDGPSSSDEATTTTSTTEEETAYLCSQSEQGQLTHYFGGNHHAIDFACPIGTPLYSPVNGTVVQVNDSGGKKDDDDDGVEDVVEVSGIAATNMFRWNSIMFRVVDDDDDADADTDTTPLFVELVHIQTDSCVVKVGDAVRKGRLVCRSGSVGFSPEPHVHVAAYRSDGDDASTVRVRFERSSGGDDCAGGGGGDDDDNGESGVELSFLPRAGGWYKSSGLVVKP